MSLFQVVCLSSSAGVWRGAFLYQRKHFHRCFCIIKLFKTIWRQMWSICLWKLVQFCLQGKISRIMKNNMASNDTVKEVVQQHMCFMEVENLERQAMVKLKSITLNCGIKAYPVKLTWSFHFLALLSSHQSLLLSCHVLWYLKWQLVEIQALAIEDPNLSSPISES